MRKRKWFRQIISAMLVVLLLMMNITQVFASSTKEYYEARQEALEILTELYGEEAGEELLEQMIALGLVDNNGNVLSYMVIMDGEEYTLEEISDYIEQPGADLTKEVTVSDQTVSLEDLKTMLEIEKEITRIYETYYTGNSLTPTEEHEQSLQSLLNQFQNEGVQLSGVGAAIGSTWVSQNARVRLETNGQTITVTLNESPVKDVTMKYQWLSASASSTLAYPDDVSGTLIFAAGAEGDELVQTIEINQRAPENNDPSTDYAEFQWNGEKVAYMMFYDIKNALFSNGETADIAEVKFEADPSFDGYGPLPDEAFTPYYTTALLNDDADVVGDGLWPFTSQYEGQNIYETYDMGRSNFYYYVTKKDTYSYLDLEYDFSLETPNGEAEKLGMESPLPINKQYLDEGIISAMSVYFTDDWALSDLYKNPALQGVEYYYLKDAESNQLISRRDLSLNIHPIGTERYTHDFVMDLTADDGYALKQLQQSDSFSITVEVRYPYRFTAQYLNFSIGQGPLTFRFLDEVPPTVTSVTAPAGVYEPGQTVPIMVGFSEPVTAAEQMTLSDGTTLSRVESDDTISYFFTYLYTVPTPNENDALSLYAPGAVDIAGNVLEEEEDPQQLEGVTLETFPPKRLSFEQVSTDQSSYDAGAAGGTVTVTLSDNADYLEWLLLDYDVQTDTFPGVKASVDGGETLLDLKADQNLTEMTVQFALTPDTDYRDMRAELYLKDEDGEGYSLLIGGSYHSDFSMEGVVLITEDDLEFEYPDPWPSGQDYLIYHEKDEPNIQLKVNNNNLAATYQDFQWEIIQEDDIATINDSGEIQPTGNTYGMIKVRVTATNGEIYGFDTASITTPSIEIKTGNNAFLDIPTSANTFLTSRGKPVDVTWSSNIVYKNQTEKESPEDTAFTLTMYEGYHDADTDFTAMSPAQWDDGGSQKDAKWIVENNNTFTIPAEALTTLSAGGKPAYTFQVEVEHPFSDETLSTIGYITVNMPAVELTLDHSINRFVLDSAEPFSLDWTMEYFDTVNESSFEFIIYKGAEEVAGSEISFEPGVGFTSANADENGGRYSFTPDTVDSDVLYDLYTVELKAKNATDSTWSYDSMVLYVYNANALDILVDNVSTDSLTMSNVEKVKDSSNEEIMALYYADQLNLRNVLSINYNEYDWQLLYDQIAWVSEESRTASINYKQGSLYENIEKYSYDTYSPNTEFALSGLDDGETTILATHARTGMQRKVDVTVETLTDKLYIFQVYPQTETEVFYTNGDGESYTVTTDSDGALALYEESGITGNVQFKSEYDDMLYMATLYNSNLASGERDSTTVAQYPMNHVRMLEAATTTMHFKLPSGEPYQGEILLNGGVYKNGSYCETTQIDETDSFQIYTLGSDGKLEIKWDSTRFWSEEAGETSLTELLASDKLEYVFEVYTKDDAYYPKIIKMDTSYSYESAANTAEGIISLVELDDEEKEKPFLAADAIEMHMEDGSEYISRDTTSLSKIGPSNQIPEVVVNNTVMWWGASDTEMDSYTAKLLDEDGFVPAGQSYKTLQYPFSSTIFTEHYQVLNEETLWMESLATPGSIYEKNVYISMVDCKMKLNT